MAPKIAAFILNFLEISFPSLSWFRRGYIANVLFGYKIRIVIKHEETMDIARQFMLDYILC